jgi:hypothetical protein
MSLPYLADYYRLFPVDINLGATVLRDFSSDDIQYVGVAQKWNADTSKAIWWIIKYTMSGGQPIQDQVSPPNQIWNNRGIIFP